MRECGLNLLQSLRVDPAEREAIHVFIFPNLERFDERMRAIYS